MNTKPVFNWVKRAVVPVLLGLLVLAILLVNSEPSFAAAAKDGFVLIFLTAEFLCAYMIIRLFSAPRIRSVLHRFRIPTVYAVAISAGIILGLLYITGTAVMQLPYFRETASFIDIQLQNDCALTQFGWICPTVSP